MKTYHCLNCKFTWNIESVGITTTQIVFCPRCGKTTMEHIIPDSLKTFIRFNEEANYTFTGDNPLARDSVGGEEINQCSSSS